MFVFKSKLAESRAFSFLLSINNFSVVKTPLLINILPEIFEGTSANLSNK